jgi:hypothetical protein
VFSARAQRASKGGSSGRPRADARASARQASWAGPPATARRAVHTHTHTHTHTARELRSAHAPGVAFFIGVFLAAGFLACGQQQAAAAASRGGLGAAAHRVDRCYRPRVKSRTGGGLQQRPGAGSCAAAANDGVLAAGGAPLWAENRPGLSSASARGRCCLLRPPAWPAPHLLRLPELLAGPCMHAGGLWARLLRPLSPPECSCLRTCTALNNKPQTGELRGPHAPHATERDAP